MSEKKPIDKKLLAWKIASIVISVLFVPIIIFNSIIIVSTLAAKDKVPTAFGYGMLVILSDSMEGEFKTDDAIFIKKVNDINTLEVGDIICYRDENTYVTHRIDSITEENGQKAFKTKGDANNTVDRGSVTADEIQGVYVGKATGLYNLIDFLQSPLGVMLVFIIPCLIYARYEVYLWQKKKEEELAGVRDELRVASEALLAAEARERRLEDELSVIRAELADALERLAALAEPVESTPEVLKHYSKEEYLHLGRKKKKRVKTNVLAVDAGRTDSIARIREAEQWREGVHSTQKKR